VYNSNGDRADNFFFRNFSDRFADSGDVRDKGETKPTRLKIQRRMKQNETVKVYYEVIDNTDILKPDDWDRVVCVFTTGAEWQFKKFKWQKPVELFAQVKGFYAKWADEQPKETIKTWNVEILSVCWLFFLLFFRIGW
jgi:parafibromin